MNAYSKHYIGEPTNTAKIDNRATVVVWTGPPPTSPSWARTRAGTYRNRGFFPTTVLPCRMCAQILCGNTAAQLIDSHVFLLSLTLSHTHNSLSLSHAQALLSLSLSLTRTLTLLSLTHTLAHSLSHPFTWLHMALKKCIFCFVTTVYAIIIIFIIMWHEWGAFSWEL